jgi:endonuclease/exonuclease/phosphatase family metal-dependent hydrolase
MERTNGRIRRHAAALLSLIAVLVFPGAQPPRGAAAASSPEPCRTAVAPGGGPAAQAIRWIRPDSARERRALDRWCNGVGPVVFEPHLPVPPRPGDPGELIVVSWNVHVGAGDVRALVNQLRSGRLTDGQPVEQFVLLLQEAYRSGPWVPHEERSGARVPRPIRPRMAGRERIDIVNLSSALGLSLYYAPSMRNGWPHQTDEDRGNAILSTLPLSDPAAIELPFVRQRRVALSATVHGHRPAGEPWTLRVTNTHFDNLGSVRRFWIFSTGSRLRQARGLLEALGTGQPSVLGGDLNTWFGFRESAYRELAANFTHEARTDPGPTFAGLLRLDHLLFRLPHGWQVRTVRLDAFGSDHRPLLARLQLAPAMPDRNASHAGRSTRVRDSRQRASLNFSMR